MVLQIQMKMMYKYKVKPKVEGNRMMSLLSHHKEENGLINALC